MTNRREPISLDELLKKRQQAEEAEKRPKFLSKEERARLALERRQQQVATGQRPAAAAPNPPSNGVANTVAKKEPLLGAEASQLIKDRYLGGDSAMGATKRQIRRTGDKKFSFDWSHEEDTTIDEIYNHSKSIQPMFGRGSIAGVDSAATAAALGSKTAAESKNRWNDVNWREKPLKAMTERDWRILREDFNITTKGGNIPRPIRGWNEAPVPDELKDIIDDIGYKEPTPIQRQSIPIGLENRDLIGIAQTGSGKTAAFLIPLLVFIMKMPRLNKERFADGPYALVMAPTRELAIQIESEARKFAQPLGFRCVSLVGGHSLEEQSLALDRGAEIIIGTPGRLKDVLDRRILVLNQCSYLVMDEADRMMDMGFEQDVNYVLAALPVSNQKPDTDDAERTDKIMRDGLPVYRQTTMFSATMPPAVEKIVKQYLRRPAIVTIGETGKAVDTVEQRIEMIGEEKKQDRIVTLLQRWDPPVIIFVNLKATCDALSRSLGKAGYRVATLHGGKSQDMREFALNELRSGKKDILVATDVAGRGIDVPNVSLVVNYDMAKDIQAYTHRIGRTGRAGKSGVAITFLTPEDAPVYYDLKQMLAASGKCPPELARHEAAQTRPMLAAAKRKLEGDK